MKFLRTGTLAAVVASAALIAPGAALAAASGLDAASATPGAASASPLQLNGLLVLNKSDTTATGSNITVLQVLGMNLLSKNGAGVNQGALAVAGTLLDAINKALCAKGTEASGFCVGLLFTNTQNGAAGINHNASGATAAITLGSIHLRVLGSEASTTLLGGGAACASTARSFVLNMSNIPSVPGLNIENDAIAGPGAC